MKLRLLLNDEVHTFEMSLRFGDKFYYYCAHHPRVEDFHFHKRLQNISFFVSLPEKYKDEFFDEFIIMLQRYAEESSKK